MTTPLSELVARVGRLPAGREALATLTAILEDPLVETARLLPVVERDPGLAAGLLRLCNSPYYGFRRRIGTPREALALVGNLAFARLALSLTLEPVLARGLPGYGEDTGRLWEHSLVTAYGAAALAVAMGRRDQRDRAFTAGLLHDVGKLVLDPELAAARRRDGADAPRPGTVTLAVERTLAGWDHGEAGGALLASWGLPAAVAAAVRWHHVPELAADHADLAEAVHLAEKIAHFAAGIRDAAAGVEAWVADTVDPAVVPWEAVRRLVSAVLIRQGSPLALVAGAAA